MTCSVGSRKEVGSVGRVSSHRPVRSFFQFGNGEGKIILLFGYVGRYPTSLKEMRIPDHLTCLLRNLYAGQEATVRTGHGTTDCFQIGKGVPQGCILSPCLFNVYAKYIMRNAGWMKHKLQSRLSGEISITSDIEMTPPLRQKVKKN